MFNSEHPAVKEAKRRNLVAVGSWREMLPGYFAAAGHKVRADSSRGEAVLLVYRPYAETRQLSVFVAGESHDVPELTRRAAAMRVAVFGKPPEADGAVSAA